MCKYDSNDDLWQLFQHIQSLKEQLDHLHQEADRRYSDYVAELEGVQAWCDGVLLEAARIYSLRSGNA